MIQWTLIALSPLFFFLGLVLVEWRRNRAQFAIKQLRSEFSRESGGSGPAGFARRSSASSGMPASAGRNSRARRASMSGSLFGANGSSGPSLSVRARRKDAYEEFFDYNARYGKLKTAEYAKIFFKM